MLIYLCVSLFVLFNFCISLLWFDGPFILTSITQRLKFWALAPAAIDTKCLLRMSTSTPTFNERECLLAISLLMASSLETLAVAYVLSNMRSKSEPRGTLQHNNQRPFSGLQPGIIFCNVSIKLQQNHQSAGPATSKYVQMMPKCKTLCENPSWSSVFLFSNECKKSFAESDLWSILMAKVASKMLPRGLQEGLAHPCLSETCIQGHTSSEPGGSTDGLLLHIFV